VLELTRREVKLALSEATQRDVVVTDDATAWAALKLLHGDLCDKKGGALHGVKAHERAALAVAVAFALRQAKPAEIAP
jgi:predicted secreted protein